MYFIFWYDYLLLPIYLLIMVLFLRYYFQKKHGNSPELKKHFNRGLWLKIVGCIALGLIYEYYYKGAYDGWTYFEGGKMLRNYWLDHPTEFLHTLFSDINDFNDTNLDGLKTFDARIFADESFQVAKFVGLFNLLSFNAFFPCSLFFCLFAFLGLWNFFIFLLKEFNLNYRMAAFCSLYVPSILLWDSGIFKDTVTFTALLWLFMCGYYAFIKPRRVLRNVIGMALAIMLILYIKVYILAAFAPFFILYIFNYHKSKIKNPAVKFLSTPFIIGLSALGIVFFFQNADELLGRYSVDQVLETATYTYSAITSEGQAGSAYAMNVDLNSPEGLLAAVPAGINVTLFRPYPWEFLKPFTLLASIESMIVLYLTLFVFFKVGFFRSLRTIWVNPTLQLCILFSLLFAFMIGISAANFGTLVRYKIPCLPFYTLFLTLLYGSKFPQAIQRGLSKPVKKPVMQPAHLARSL